MAGGDFGHKHWRATYTRPCSCPRTTVSKW